MCLVWEVYNDWGRSWQALLYGGSGKKEDTDELWNDDTESMSEESDRMRVGGQSALSVYDS